MPADFDELDDLQDNGTDDTTTDDSDETSSPPEGDKSEKRIRDLQSRADKAEAKANRLQQMLEKALRGGDESEDGEPKAPARKAPVLDAGTSMALELLKETVFLQTPGLAEAGYTAADLTGYSAAEVRASAASLARKNTELETRIRNKVLAEHGLAPEIVGSTKAPEPVQDYGKMSSKDFSELMERVMKG